MATMRSFYLGSVNLFRFQYRFINNGKASCNENKKVRLVNQAPKSFCSPGIDEKTLKNIKSVVGIQTGLSYISWAKIETKENLLSCMNFLSLSDGIYKMKLHQIYDIAYQIISNLPVADCYVMESLPKIVAGGTGGKLQLSSQATRMQFIAMIVAMLNQNQGDERFRVVFMAPRTTAKLFRLLVGSEITSSEAVVTELLSRKLKHIPSLECTPEIVSSYTQAERVEKEMLGQALLLTVSFTELVIHKSEECYDILFDYKRKS